ncbi:MAG TPA: dihydrodipicolinate synthase family protein [Vicinamibacterales bacterium]|nr:dihydrodipicolinate synthase family protein [Vicinamibacterales bacterium]
MTSSNRAPQKPFAGIFSPIATPFTADDTVDEGALRRNVARWMQTPLTGLVVLGSNGEAPQLEEAEADRVIDIVREGVPSTRPLLAGTGRESTKATIEATKRAARAGVDAALARTPSFFKSQMTSDIFVRHYREVADASPIPILLYNVTMFTGVNMQPDAVERLAMHPNIVGLKESGGDIAQIAEYVARTPDDFTVLAGSATTLYPALCAGCDGAVLALAMLFPDECVRMRALVSERRLDEAMALQQQLLPIAKLVGATYGVAGLKAALDVLGYEGGLPRPPLRPASQSVIDAITREIDALYATTRT